MFVFKRAKGSFKESLYLFKHDFALYLPWSLIYAFFVSFKIIIISRIIFYCPFIILVKPCVWSKIRCNVYLLSQEQLSKWFPREEGQTKLQNIFLCLNYKQWYGQFQYLLSDFSLNFTIRTTRLYSDEDAYIQF